MNKLERRLANLGGQRWRLTEWGSKHRLDQTSICWTGTEPAKKFELGLTRQPRNSPIVRKPRAMRRRESLLREDWRAVRRKPFVIFVLRAQRLVGAWCCFPAGAAHRIFADGTADRSSPGRGRFCRGRANSGRRRPRCDRGALDGRVRWESDLSRWWVWSVGFGSQLEGLLALVHR